MWLRAFIAWFALLLLAIANGIFREFVLLLRLGAPKAHIVCRPGSGRSCW